METKAKGSQFTSNGDISINVGEDAHYEGAQFDVQKGKTVINAGVISLLHRRLILIAKVNLMLMVVQI